MPTQHTTRAAYPREAINIAVDGTAPWQNPQRVFIDDNQTSTTSLMAGGGESGKLRIFDFGFTASDIPANARILAVYLNLKARSSAMSIADESVRLCIGSNHNEVGDNQADPDSWPLTETPIIRGGGLWGYPLTPEILWDEFFGFTIQLENTDETEPATGYIDYAEVEVCYELPDVPAPADPSVIPPNETPLQKAQRKLALWEAAEDAISEGQSYQIKSTTLTRADLKLVREQISHYEGRVERLSKGRGRGAMVIRIAPTD